jgi:hypothetical protein
MHGLVAVWPVAAGGGGRPSPACRVGMERLNTVDNMLQLVNYALGFTVNWGTYL